MLYSIHFKFLLTSSIFTKKIRKGIQNYTKHLLKVNQEVKTQTHKNPEFFLSYFEQFIIKETYKIKRYRL